MVYKCDVLNCKYKSEKLPLFKLPKVARNAKPRIKKLLRRQREAWLLALKSSKASNVVHVCGKHFVKGKPANFKKTNDSDWVPTLEMGTEKPETESNVVFESGSSNSKDETEAKVHPLIDHYDVLKVPNELWSQIVKHLPLLDRKCIRLTCRQFYDACNTLSFQKNETHVFLWKSQFDDRYLSFQPYMNVERKVWNIEIGGTIVIDDSAFDFFKKWGTRVRSVVLHGSRFSFGLLRTIIEHCQSLNRLVLNYTDVDENLMLMLNDFATLQNLKIVSSSVEEFTLNLPEPEYNRHIPLTNRVFLRFFSVLPNIRNLNMTLGIEEEFFEETCDLTSNTVFSLPCLLHQLREMSDQLEKLALNLKLPKYLTFMHPIPTTPEFARRMKMKNLKELSLNWYTASERVNIESINPHFEFDHLTHLHCHIAAISLSDFIVSLLATATELRSLVADSPDDNNFYHLYARAFAAIVQSKLVSLKFLSIPCEYSLEGRSRFGHCPGGLATYALSPNYSLKILDLDSDDLQLWSLFVLFFRNLDHLQLPKIGEGVFRNLCEKQLNLRSLKVINCAYPTHGYSPVNDFTLNYWLSKGRVLSNRKLQHLTHLHIVEETISLPLTKFMLNELLLPNLQKLTINCRTTADEGAPYKKNIWQFIGKVPQVQHVQLEMTFETSFQQWLSLVRILPKLRILDIRDPPRQNAFPTSYYRRLFTIRSSLLTVRHNGENYYINYSNNTMASLEKFAPL